MLFEIVSFDKMSFGLMSFGVMSFGLLSVYRNNSHRASTYCTCLLLAQNVYYGAGQVPVKDTGNMEQYNFIFVLTEFCNKL